MHATIFRIIVVVPSDARVYEPRFLPLVYWAISVINVCDCSRKCVIDHRRSYVVDIMYAIYPRCFIIIERCLNKITPITRSPICIIYDTQWAFEFTLNKRENAVVWIAHMTRYLNPRHACVSIIFEKYSNFLKYIMQSLQSLKMTIYIVIWVMSFRFYI